LAKLRARRRAVSGMRWRPERPELKMLQMPTHCRRLRAWAFAGLGVALILATCPAASASTAAPVFTVGDIHGDLDALISILRQANLVDAAGRWAGGKATLVQTGDMLDRGPKDRQVMDLLMALEKQAAKAGGSLVVLLGNHEAMNLTGDLRYVSKETYASFADAGSEKRRQAAWRDHLAWQKAAAEARGEPAPVPTSETEAAWMEAHPLGFLEHREAMAPDGKYGRWLRSRPAVARVGDTLFVHGGLSPALAGVVPKLEDLNRRVSEEIALFDAARRHLLERRLALPWFTLDELLQVARSELDARGPKAAPSQPEAQQATPAEDPETQRHVGLLEALLKSGSWLLVHPDGPLWFRGYATWTDEEGAASIASVLTTYNAARIVVGHTQDHAVRMRWDGKVFLIDSGMLSSYFQGGRASILELAAGKVTAIYLDQRLTLLDPNAAPAAQAPAPAPPPAPAPETAAETASEPPSDVPETADAAEPSNAVERPARVWYDPDGNPLPFRTDEEVMEFLRSATVARIKGTPRGVAGTRKVTLEKDGLRMNAAFRSVREEKSLMKLPDGRTEMEFRDDFIFESAAYALAGLLGLDNVPPTVQRKIRDEPGTLQAWVEGGMVELERQNKKIEAPKPQEWNKQLYVMRVFDNLIFNTDRNQGNMIIDRNWKLWLIDHTRAFRRLDFLNATKGLARCERGLMERLRSLPEEEIRAALKDFLRKAEIDGLLKRRQKLVDHFQKRIEAQGEAYVLFTFD
jgi:hypothetical protein